MTQPATPRHEPLHSHRPVARRQPSFVFFLPWAPGALGGVNRVVLSLAHEMQAEGSLHPIIFSSDWTRLRPVAGEYAGIETLSWQVRPLNPASSLRERLAFRCWEAHFGRLFADFCRRRDVVCVNPHYPGPSSFALARVIERFGIDSQLFLSFHGSDVSRFSALDEAGRRRWRQLLRRADATIACSASLRERLASALGRHLPVATVHNGIDLQLFSPDARAPGASLQDGPQAKASATLATVPSAAARRTVLCVGSFDANKNQRLLLQAFALLAPGHPEVDLCLVGADGPERQPLQAQAAAAGLGERVRFVLDVPAAEVARYYAQASAFVLPSLSESFGLVLLEAGAFALPVVATDLPSTREILTPGEHALLFPSGDAGALAQQLGTVLAQPRAAAAMGAALQQHVAQHFRWRTALDRYLALLDPALARQGTGQRLQAVP